MEDLEELIQHIQQIVDVTPQGHLSLIGHLQILGNQLMNRFDITGRIEDLEESIQCTQQAVNITPHDHPSLPVHLSNLGILLQKRFEWIGRMEDFEESIRCTQQAVDITPQGHPNLAVHLCNLGILLQRRFEWIGRIEDSEESIRCTQQAVDSTPQDNPHLGQSLCHLGVKLMNRFERTGRMEDLDESVRRTQQAVDITPPDHPNLAICLRSLGNHLLNRFVRTDRMEDLEESIRRTQQAVDITPQGHPDLAGHLQILGNQLMNRFDRTHRMEDLEKSIQHTQQAVDITPKGHPDLTGHLQMLGNQLMNRFDITGRIEDLEKSIQHTQHAVDITPQDHPNLAGRLNNLSIKLKSQFERTGRMEYLEESIKQTQKAVNISRRDDPNLAIYLHNLGRILSLSPEAQHQDQALRNFQQSWNCHTGIPFCRLDSALEAVRLLKQRSDWLEALKIAKEAIHLIPIMNNRSLSRDDQQVVASRFSGLAGNACCLLLQFNGDATEALHLLELGRGVILGLLMDDRSDISALRQSHPGRAAAFDRLRNEVNMPVHEPEDVDMQRDRMTRRLEAVKELDEVINIIRQLPGYERFLLGLTLDELKKQAAEGPIVVVNVTDIRSDAIIVSKSAVKSVRLPQLTEANTIKWLNQELTTYHDPQEKGKKNKRYLEFLRWLWSSCVEVILLEIHSIKRPDPDNLPRVWWIGVGIASHLPFHAAGIHLDGSTNNTLSWVISSYTPTIKALAHARERGVTSVKIHNDTLKLLVVTMPTTLGERDLPGVESEEAAIEMVARSAFLTHALNQPDAKMVREKLAQCDMLHFAGHGVSDYTDPFNSRLLLQKCHGAVTTVDGLTVRDIFDLNLKGARIAYLSACSTAEIRAGRLVDEVIHLASGFQVAGFSHVIASMWQTDDDACEKMARGFYEQLKHIIEGDVNNRAVAVAAHQSIMEMRSKWMRFPLLWAPYVHFGA
jgi:tetratricopeptide (TPR) repeat protein